MDKWPTKTMESGYDHIPKAVKDEAEPEAVDADMDAALELQRVAVVLMIAEVVRNADIVGQQGDATVYLLHLSAGSAATLAALGADVDKAPAPVADELDDEFTSDLGELDSGEFEDDG